MGRVLMLMAKVGFALATISGSLWLLIKGQKEEEQQEEDNVL